MYKHLRIPPFLQVKKLGIDAGPRNVKLVAKEPIERGTRLFTREIYAAGISGKTVSDIRSVCHNCLAKIGDAPPVVCRECKIVSYCSIECLQAARSLHAMECNGIIDLEKLRGKEVLDVPSHSRWLVDQEQYWPPAHALLAARAINRRAMTVDQGATDWIDYVSIPGVTEPTKVEQFAKMLEYIRLLVPDHISDHEITQSLIAACVHFSVVEDSPINTYNIALYNVEYYLFNHKCKPNCEIEKVDDRFAMYTIEDIQKGEILAISLVKYNYFMNVREVRRPRLFHCFNFECFCYLCRGETEPGSKLWLLEKQKSSLIAPWSFSMARHMMVKAWEVLIECDNALKNSPLEYTEKLGSCFETQKLILDPRNVMYILTATALLLKYCQAKAYAKAVDIFHKCLSFKGLKAMAEYGTRMVVAEITGAVSVSLFELNMIEQFHALFQLTQKIHPRHPSCKELCRMLQLEDDTQWLSTEELVIDDELNKMFQVCAEKLGVPHEFYEEAAHTYLTSQFDQKPTLSEMLEACKDV